MDGEKMAMPLHGEDMVNGPGSWPIFITCLADQGHP